jgi:uncharacterized protein (TIGR02271 family)
MTMQADQIIGARVTGGDGQVVGTVEQVFNDDSDGRPAWARVRSGERERFVPLAGGRVSGDGLVVAFGAEQIMSGPEVSAGRHMSAAQAEQLSRHFGLAAAGQAGERGDGAPAGGKREDAARAGGERDDAPQAAGEREDGAAAEDGGEWLVRAEERLAVGTERRESGRARLRKYVDTEPAEQQVRVYHEEYEIERVPVAAGEQLRGVIGEGDQEVVLHEERAVARKETVPVERVRLAVRRVAEDRTVREELRRERVEVEPGDGSRAAPPGGPAGDQRRR